MALSVRSGKGGYGARKTQAGDRRETVSPRHRKDIFMTATTLRRPKVVFRNLIVQGVKIAYREAGPPNAPTVILLHGVPSSSRMYDRFMREFGERYRFIAMDYPGFGNSAAPPPNAFAYSFAHLAEIVLDFIDALGIKRYTLFMQDYGAPVGMRVALARPEAVQAVIFQNGNVYEDGLGPLWTVRKAYWRDRAAYEAKMREGHLSLEVTKSRHIGDDPDIEAYDPDLWGDELAFLHRPGQIEIQLELIYDYQTNIESYPAWQEWLRHEQPPALVIWGRHDLGFLTAGARAFARDLPKARIEILDTGHFAMDTRFDEVVELTAAFLSEVYPG